MRVLIIISVALVSVIGLTYLANAETITIKKDKSEVGQATGHWEKVYIDSCQHALATGAILHQHDDTSTLKDYGYITKHYWIFVHYQSATVFGHYCFSMSLAQDLQTVKKQLGHLNENQDVVKFTYLQLKDYSDE